MSRSEEIYQILLKELQAGNYPEGSRFPSEYLLADRFQINKSTASKIVLRLVELGCLRRGIRGEGTLVSMETCFPVALFAFLCKDLTPYVSRLLTGAQNAALRRQCALVPWPHFEENMTNNLKLLSHRNIKGALAVQNDSILLPGGQPVIYLDRDHTVSDSVTNNNFESGQSMMREILNHNHRNILIFNTGRFSYFKSNSIHLRVQGFWDEMARAGISDFRERSALCIPHTLPEVSYHLQKMLAQYPDTTLIATDSDETAELLWTAARHENIPLGDSIALTGFGNCSHLPIASVEQYPELVGECAMQLLFKRLSDGPGEAIHEQLRTKMVHLEFIPYI